MYNIVFYEDSNGNCDLRDFLHMMQQKKKRAFYKLVAFLDYLAEKGADDKAVCRSPGYTIYMHGIPGVCVILYAQCRKDSDGEEIYVLLHHYFTDRTSGGVPLIQLYNAIRKLRRYRQMAGGRRGKRVAKAAVQADALNSRFVHKFQAFACCL